MPTRPDILIQKFLRDERIVTVEERSGSDREKGQSIIEFFGSWAFPEPECYRHLACDPAYNESLMARGGYLIGAVDVGASRDFDDRLSEFCDYCGGGMRRENQHPQDARLTPKATNAELTSIGFELICELAATCNRSVETITFHPMDKTPLLVFRIKWPGDPEGLPGFSCGNPLCESARFMACRGLQIPCEDPVTPVDNGAGIALPESGMRTEGCQAR